VAILGVLILYPIAILLCSTICFVFMVTVWIWVPLVMVLVYLFNILIFQFEIGGVYDGCLIRSVPLVSLLFKIVFALLKILFFTVVLLVFGPLASILYLLFLILQRVFRTFTDTIMLCLIACCGRTPSNDTSIARKISGPGMSRYYYYSIAEPDVYVLTQCALERIFVNKCI
jgi:hypothetical protein